MPNLTPALENEIITALDAKISTVDGADNVIYVEPLIDSKADFIDELTVQNIDSAIETRYIKIDYLGWRDSPVDGCDDNPVTFIRYKIRLFHSYSGPRSDASTPHGDIKTLDLLLHSKFLEPVRTLAANSEHAPLVSIQDMILNEDELTGVFGYSRELSIEIEVI
ncbi:MAG: hypothetical protein ABIP06_06115 [Pyrinomonadaceae bacterium]